MNRTTWTTSNTWDFFCTFGSEKMEPCGPGRRTRANSSTTWRKASETMRWQEPWTWPRYCKTSSPSRSSEKKQFTRFQSAFWCILPCKTFKFNINTSRSLWKCCSKVTASWGLKATITTVYSFLQARSSGSMKTWFVQAKKVRLRLLKSMLPWSSNGRLKMIRFSSLVRFEHGVFDTWNQCILG